MFEWLNTFATWIVQFFPHRAILNPTQGGIKFKRGHTPVACGPGIHWWWPALTQFEIIPMVRQADNLRSQTMITTDDRAIAVSGMIVHEVSDIIVFATSSHDGFETIKEITLTAIHDVICQMSWTELRLEQQKRTLDTKLKNAAKHMLKEYGVNVIKVMLTDLSPVRVLRLMQSTSAD